jgi:GWxTD domain-containing protein
MIKALRFTLMLAIAATAVAAPPAGKDNYLQWGDSPEALFLTTQERGQWDTILGKEDADKFIANYWAKHGEAFHKEVLARIAAADKYFSMKDRKGSTMERGRVFIILGSPTKETNNRTTTAQGGFGTNVGGANSIERQGVVRTEWFYRKDRLPQELGVPELWVDFQTDVARGYETIENPGIIEPYLHKYVDWFVAKNAPGTVAPAVPTTAVQAATPDLWAETPNLNGAYFTGEPFISPTEKSFYAYSFYLPQSVATLAGAKDVVLQGSIKDANGATVANFRQPASTPTSYDQTGDRFADGAVELAPGKYSGMFALYSGDGNKMLASSRTEFEVPELTAARVSRPFLTSHIDTLDKQGAFDPWTFVAMKYAVKGNAQFKKSDSIGWFTYIANPSANPNPSMTMRMKVSKDGKVIDTSAPMPADLQQTGPHTYLLATRFDPNTLQPGHYNLELTLKDTIANKSYTTSTEFEVR